MTATRARFEFKGATANMLTSPLSQKPVLSLLVLRETIFPTHKKELGGKINNVSIKERKGKPDKLDAQSHTNQVLRYNCNNSLFI